MNKRTKKPVTTNNALTNHDIISMFHSDETTGYYVSRETFEPVNIEKNNIQFSVDTVNELYKTLVELDIKCNQPSTQPYVIGNMSCSFYKRNMKTGLIRVGVSLKMYGLCESLKTWCDNFVSENFMCAKSSNGARNYILDLNDIQFNQYLIACGNFIKLQ